MVARVAVVVEFGQPILIDILLDLDGNNFDGVCDHRRGWPCGGEATKAVGSRPTVHPRRTRLG